MDLRSLKNLAALAVPLALGGPLAACRKPAPREQPALLVAAAADLAVAFTEVGAAFEKASGQKVAFTFGSTGLLARQIEEGAPFRVFAAADASFVDAAVAKGACLGETKAFYARGRLVLFTPKGTRPPSSLADLADARFGRIAIANPEHAPYGVAAREALERAGVLERVAGKLVYGENVRQALQFASSGNADVAIVALSLAASAGGELVPVDPALHRPIDQAIVVCRGPGPDASLEAGARRFAAFVASSEARSILARHGFSAPSSASPRGPAPE
jgi:molybdate transport system substrate-binding protein